MNREEYLIFISINGILLYMDEEDIKNALPEKYAIYKKVKEEIIKKGGEK